MLGGIKVPRVYLMLMLNNVIYQVVAGGWTHTKDGLADIKFVRPYHSTASGKFISHDILPISEKKPYPNKKSDTTSGIESPVVQHYTIKLDGELLVMSLARDSSLIAETVEDINQNIKNRIQSKCLLIGSVINDSNSRAVIDNCDGTFNGWICGTNFDYYLHGNPNTDLHNLYRVDKHSAWRNNDTDAVSRSVCHRQPSRDRRSAVDQTFTIELAILVDYSLQAFHGEGTKDYILVLMNLAADSFRDSSFKFNVNLVISKIIYLDQHNSSLMIDKSSVSRTRQNVGHYMFHFNTMDDTNPDHFDACVYITRNFFGPEGYAKTSGVCSMLESTVIVRDGGYRSAYVIAHEIGHLLSIEHDGSEWNSCQKDVSKKSIMSPQVASTYSQHPWSECSNNYFKEFVKLPKAKCLQDEPFHDKVLHLPGEVHPGMSISSDDQCKAAYDSKYATCVMFATGQMLCEKLWCSKIDKPYFCSHKNVPPLEGTACGKNKWCIHGKCVDSPKKKRKKNVVDGGWTDWSKRTECSLSCGIGVSSRSRTCTNPEPKNGGKYCKGDNIEYTTCNVQLCNGENTDIRAELCREKNQVLIPAIAENESEQCLLKCVPKLPATGEAVVIGPVQDGTFCSYDNPSSICIDGECTKLGCDYVIGSQAKVDSCGVCKGTNETCSTTKVAFKQKMKKNAYVITTIPVDARHIRVVEKARSGHFLALRNVDMGENIIDTRSSVWPTSGRSVISAGVKLTFSINDDGMREITSSPGPILNKLSVKIYRNKTDSTVPSFKCRFITKREEEGLTIFASARSARVDVVRKIPQSQYDWVTDGTTKCSATCGGGLQKKIYKCKRTSDMKVVNKRKCKSNAPNTQTACAEQACKTYSWDVSAWSDCSKTCGQGERTRSVKCIRSVNGKTKTMRSTHCAGTSPRPSTTKTCSVRSC